VGSQDFPLKNFSREVDLGGVYTKYLHFGGGPNGIARKWGGSASGARRAQNWYTPPPRMFLTPSLNAINFYEALTEPNTEQTTQGLARATKVQQVKNNAYYLERSDRGIQECNESRAEVGIRNRPTLQQKAVQTSSLHGKAQGPLRLH